MSAQPTVRGAFLPAPVRGMDTRASAYSEGSDLAYLIRDMIPKNSGVDVRPGWKEWVTNVGLTAEGAAQQVRTVAPFHDENNANDKLWAFTKGGIYDATSSASDPTQDTALPVGTSEGGWFSWTNFTSTAGTHYLLAVDGLNGYWIYSVAGGWVEVTQGAGASQINGVDPRTLSFVTSWKRRVWFVEKNSSSGWYLSANAIFGTASEFNFGSKFRYGGHLVGLYNFTIDGGSGIDDFLVAISSAGDVCIYQGTDPSDASKFGLVGSWYVGPTPKGNRIATEFGGDLFILSEFGIVPLSRILQGAAATEAKAQLSTPIINTLNTAIINSRGERSWEMKIATDMNTLIVISPEDSTPSVPNRQFVMELTQNSWSTFSSVPMLTGDLFQGDFYFGTDDGRVCIMDGNRDAVLRDGSGGSAIDWALITRSSDFGLPAQFKRVQMFRPVFLSEDTPSYIIEAKYDADFAEPGAPQNPATLASSVWDTALWDSDDWIGGEAPYSPATGSLGIGINVAYALRGRSNTPLTFIGTNVMFDSGGFL